MSTYNVLNHDLNQTKSPDAALWARQKRRAHENTGVAKQNADADVVAWLRSIGMQQYSPLFGEHKLTFDQFQDIDHYLLCDIGIHCAGDRLSILRALKQARILANHDGSLVYTVSASSHHRTPVLSALFQGFFGGGFVTMGGLSKTDTINLNNQVGFIAALVWFANVTYLIAADSRFKATPETWSVTAHHKLHGGPGLTSHTPWWYLAALLGLVISVVVSFLATFMAVYNSLILMTVPNEKFDDYMIRIGNRLQIWAIRFFMGGAWTLAITYFFTFFILIPWPFNAVFLSACGLIMLPWLCLTSKGILVAYELNEGEDREYEQHSKFFRSPSRILWKKFNRNKNKVAVLEPSK